MALDTHANWWQKLMQIFPSSSPGSWFFSRTLHHIDRVLMSWSGGRWSIPRLLTGLPVVRLTTTGAKSGKQRTVPVIAIPQEEKLILIASNWGRAEHPAWYRNLKENPEVTVEIEDQTRKYVAQETTGEERQRYWNKAVDVYSGYEAYAKRAKDRKIPVVVLTPEGE